MKTQQEMTPEELRDALAAAEAFASKHLPKLAADVESLHHQGQLGGDSTLAELVRLCQRFAGVKAKSVAEDLVNTAARQHAVSAAPVVVDVDDLAQEIRRVDGSHELGAGALAEALLPFLTTRGARRSAITGKDLRDAFDEGFSSPETYNDKLLNSVDDAWEKSDARRVHDASL